MSDLNGVSHKSILVPIV